MHYRKYIEEVLTLSIRNIWRYLRRTPSQKHQLKQRSAVTPMQLCYCSLHVLDYTRVICLKKIDCLDNIWWKKTNKLGNLITSSVHFFQCWGFAELGKEVQEKKTTNPRPHNIWYNDHKLSFIVGIVDNPLVFEARLIGDWRASLATTGSAFCAKLICTVTALATKQANYSVI